MSTPPPTTPTQYTDIMVAISRLEGKIDTINLNILNHEKDISDHENRLRKLEKWRWQIPSATIILNGIMVIIGYISIHH